MANLLFSTTFLSPGGGVGNLTQITPYHDVWDFDDEAVSSWDTDTTASTEAELEAAITTAMGLGTTASPQYHRITRTGGAINSRMTLQSAAAIPDKYGPHIQVDGGNFTEVNAEISIYTISNVKFVGFQFQNASAYVPSGQHEPCVRLYNDGGGRRVSFACNRFGQAWAGGARNTFPWGFRTSTGGHNWELAVKDNEFNSVFEIVEWSGGKLDIRHNLVRDLIDDFVFCAARSHGEEAYVYALGNVIVDTHDDPSDVGFHTDFIQCADNTDGASDSYRIQAQGNLYIGNSYQQYPTMAAILQRQGGAVEFRTQFEDNIFLNVGSRGFWLPDRRCSLHRNFHAWPPLGGAVPTSGTGWSSGPFRQSYKAGQVDNTVFTPLGTDADVDIGHYWAGGDMTNQDGWGASTLVNPAQIIDHTAALGGPTSYDQRFPNMTGLAFNAETLIIDNGFASVPRTIDDLCAWVSDTYEPHTVANGTGWAANGFNDPARWF